MSDTTIWIITAAAVILIALVIFVYRREIRLKFKGHGIHAELHAKATEPPTPSPGSRNVSIGRDATGNLIKTGDDAAACGRRGAQRVHRPRCHGQHHRDRGRQQDRLEVPQA
jgi:hypothetical protein